MSTSILLYGRTGAGKSSQLGVLAEHVYKTAGLKTRLATADRGGVNPIQAYIDLGIIEPIFLAESNPWVWINKVVRGYIRNEAGKWILDQKRNEKIGVWAFESLRSVAEVLMTDMVAKVAQGGNIGGGANIAFTVQGDGETLKVSGQNIAMFGVAQGRMVDEVWASQRLPGQYIVWTSSVSKDDDVNAAGKILGPDIIGKALTAEVPRWFSYTFKIDVLPSAGGQPGRHVLYLDSHLDANAGNTAAMGNSRLPLDAPPLTKITIEPASIVEALRVVEAGGDVAKEAIRKRLNL